MKRISYNDAVVRAAKFRAIVQAALGANPQIAVSVKDVADWKDIAALRMSQVNVGDSLIGMRNRGLLKAERDGVRYLYSLPSSKKHQLTAKDKPVKTSPAKLSNPAVFTIDIVKSTGRVRLTLDQLVIEVGVA